MSFKDYLPSLFFRIFLGTIFLFAGFVKLTEPVENFRGMILSYGVVPYAWVGVIAHMMPWIEFLGGAALILGYLPRVAASVLGGLALSFVTLILAAKLHGTLPLNCGCFGDSIHMSPYQMVALDSVNIVIAARLAILKTHRLAWVA